MEKSADSALIDRPLEGRVALVTGASRGIGFAIAKSLVTAGARVHMLARTRVDIERAVHSLQENAVAHSCDISDQASVKHMARKVQDDSGGYLDVLVNSAGVFPLVSVADMNSADFENTVSTNLVGPFRVLNAFLPAMRERRSGHIVTVGSVADRAILPGNGAYSASKFGQRALHEVLRTELQNSGVRATLISPSATDTPIWDQIDPDNRPGFPSRAEMLRPEDVADAVLWALTREVHINVDELRLSAS